MQVFLRQLIVAFLSLLVAVLLVPGVGIRGGLAEQIKILVIAGAILGVANHFLKPIVELIGSPLKIFTFGLFGLITNMLMVWLVDILFPQLIIIGLWPLVWTSVLIWILGVIVNRK